MLGLKIPFGVNGAPFRKGLAQMRNDTKKWSSGMAGTIAGAFAVGSVISSMNTWMDRMDRIHKLSQRLGVSMGSLQKIDLASQLSGADLETVAKGLTKFQQNAVKAADGNKEVERSMKRLGIEASKFSGLDADKQLIELSKAYKKAEQNGTGLANIMSLMGGKAAEMIPLLAQGPEELQKSFEKATVASADTVNKVAEFNDQMTILKNRATSAFPFILKSVRTISAVVGGLVGAVVRVVIEGIGNITRAMDGASTFIDGLLEFDTQKMANGLSKVGNSIKDGVTLQARSAVGAFKDVKKEVGEIWDEKPVEKYNKVAKKSAEELLELNKLRMKLIEEEKKAQEGAMTLEQKRHALVEKRNKLEADANNTTKEGVEASLELLKVNKQIAGIDKTKNDKKKADKAKSDKANAEFGKKLNSAREKLKSNEEAFAFEGLDKKGKKNFVKNKIKKNQEAQELAKDPLGKLELKNEEVNLKRKLKGLQEGDKGTEKVANKTDNSSQTIIASSLASIGGGGGVGVSVSDPVLQEARRRNQLAQMTNSKLDSIVNAIQNQGGGEKPTTFREE